MFVLSHDFHEPAFNLACEEYFLTKTSLDIFILWRNGPSVIVGRNQNAQAEIDPEYVRAEGITVTRRITGGGAVFHDLGNICYTFITAHDGPIDFVRFCAPMVSTLRGMGLDARMTGRNDIQIGGKKISGTAQTVKAGRVLHHGTLLYSADLGKLSRALRVNSDKYSGRSVASVESRVTNIAGYLSDIPGVEEFQRRLYDEFLASEPDNAAYQLTDADFDGIAELRASKYDLDEWTFAQSGNYNFSGSVRCPAGGLRADMELESGIIKAVSLTGDFFGIEDASAFAEGLAGLRHRPEVLRKVFDDETISRVFAGFSWELLCEALF